MKLAASSLLLLTQQAVGDEIWSLSHRSLEEFDVKRIANPRLRNLEAKFLLNADLGSLFTTWESSEHSFELPDVNGNIFRVSCQLTPGLSAAHPDLLKKYPSINTLSGPCISEGLSIEDEPAVFANVIYDAERVESFSASFSLNGMSRPIYVDHTGEAGAASYVVYRGDDLMASMPPDFSQAGNDFLEIPEGVNIVEDLGPYGSTDNYQERDLQGSFTVKKYAIAMLATNGVSDFTGGTTASTLAFLISLVARLNNLYLRELGVYFELIPDNDLIVCLSNESDEPRSALCNSLREDREIVVEGVDEYMATLGVPPSAYDIGHVINTGGGGAAYSSVLCGSDGLKAGGATGIYVPYVDGGHIRILHHEIGHMLGMGHSFRDCYGSSSGVSQRHATESGGGTSVMAYPLLCGSRDVAIHPDYFFPGNAIATARGIILSTTCGQLSTVPDVRSLNIRTAAEGTCKIPIGNYVGLDITGKDPSKFYSWERNDAGYQDFFDETLGRTNAWTPMRMAAKYFPNMHYLTFPGTSRSTTELLPSAPATWRWVLTERSQYVELFHDDEMTEVDMGLVGQFHQIYTATEFVSAIPLSLSLFSNTIVAGTPTRMVLNYDRTLVSFVTVFIARNPLREIEGDPSGFEIDGEFDWVKVADINFPDPTYPPLQTPFFASLEFPEFSNSDISVAIMLRASTSPDADLCYFFDVVTGVTLRSGSASSIQASTNLQSLKSARKSTDDYLGVFEVSVAAGALVLIVILAIIVRKIMSNENKGREEKLVCRVSV